MKKYPAVLLVVVALFPVPLPAVITANKSGMAATVAAQSMANALKLRSDMANAIGREFVTPEAALIRLKTQVSSSGLKINPHADFALAAIDVGLRLVAAHKPAEAEPLFIESEKSLGMAIKETPDTAAREKAWFLAQRAFVRANFLNKTPEADSDLAAAIALQPDDQYLQRKRDQLPAGKTGRGDKQPRRN